MDSFVLRLVELEVCEFAIHPIESLKSSPATLLGHWSPFEWSLSNELHIAHTLILKVNTCHSMYVGS